MRNKNADDAQSCLFMSSLCRFLFGSFALTESRLGLRLKSVDENVNEDEE